MYPVGAPRREPKTINLVDPQTDTSYSLDLQKTVRHRDYYKIVTYTSGDFTPIPLGEYDEGLITFNNESIQTFTFSFTFSSAPVVVFTLESDFVAAADADGRNKNINVYGIYSNTAGASVGLSAPFSGTVRYRAAYAPSYPYYFQSAFAPVSGTFRASAGTVTPANLSYYTASWAALAAVPGKVLQNTFDSLSNFDADVLISASIGSLGVSSIAGDLSAPISSPINYIAYEI